VTDAFDAGGLMSAAQRKESIDDWPLLQPEDVAGAVAWLVSDAGRFVTGTSWPLDAGFLLRN
jgi:NAD(P)-dependent dehydrogenase (short-subunit alcohol dehydrogenase family)